MLARIRPLSVCSPIFWRKGSGTSPGISSAFRLSCDTTAAAGPAAAAAAPASVPAAAAAAAAARVTSALPLRVIWTLRLGPWDVCREADDHGSRSSSRSSAAASALP